MPSIIAKVHNWFVGNLRRREKQRILGEEKARRAREFWSEAWRHDAGFSQRTTLGSYEEHVAKQASKMNKMVEAGTAVIDPKTVARFKRRFELVNIQRNSKVLCLAARVGDEVLAWRELGHPDAIGIDLNPGPNNPFVVVGDFHHLQFADGSIDLVYCNSLDHAFDLDKIAGEMKRVLRSGGLLVLDIVYGHSEPGREGYRVGPLDTTHWPTAKGFGEVMATKTGFAILSVTDLEDHGSPQWVQCVMRNSQTGS